VDAQGFVKRSQDVLPIGFPQDIEGISRVRESTRIDIRSAGPDRNMGIAEELHRLQESGIHHGPDLPQESRPTTPR
jgi:hypothetical protein